MAQQMENILLKIQAELQDADGKQITNSPVKLWLDDLRDLAYDTEDVTDEFFTEILHHKITQGEASSSRTKVWSFIPSCFMSFNPAVVAFNVKMKEISSRYSEIMTQKNGLDLRERSSMVGRLRIYETWESTSLVNESQVFGRESDKEAIVELLISGEVTDNDDGVSVVSIVGMGGVGKTTLAQLVYNDDRVKHCFDVKAWVCVSEEFDVVRITKTILQSVGFQSCDGNDLNLLQVQLKERLMGKRFLVVLDDVWNENYGVWTDFRKPFEAGMMGSKIVVTTRNQGVVSVMGGTIPAYCLKELANDDCLCLFAQYALGRRDFDSHPNLKVIGEEIVRRCKGLPLAAKTLGGLLHMKRHYDEWENVLNSKIWDLPEEKSNILPALRLSYYYLPFHLKRCFAYCAIFPKDYEFDKDELVSLWMAEGFLLQPRGMKQMEDLGCEYFDELLSRSLFQRSSKESRFVMHDLINDLAQFEAGETCLNLNDKYEGNKLYTVLEKARHMSFTRHSYEVSQRFKDLHKMKRLRSFIALPMYISSWASCCYISNNVLHGLLPQLRRLRVLSLSGYCISELPNSIGGLKHLRYLNLSHTKVKQLPESVGYLFNLQTLILRGCRELTKLPQGIENLINLHCLDITDTYSLQEMPLRIGNLKSLQILPKFIVRKDNGFGLRELRDLCLRGKLSILGLHNVSDIRDARHANLRDKDGLDELELEWSADNNNSRNEDLPVQMQDVTSLQDLTICECPALVSFPKGGLPRNLTSLEIWDCENIREPMSEWNLHSLTSLRDFSIADGCFLDTIFPDEKCLLPTNLISLWIGRLNYLKSLSMGLRNLTSLEELEIVCCPKLRSLPKESLPPTLGRLSIKDCPLLRHQCSKEKGEYWPMIARIPCIDIDDITTMN